MEAAAPSFIIHHAHQAASSDPLPVMSSRPAFCLSVWMMCSLFHSSSGHRCDEELLEEENWASHAEAKTLLFVPVETECAEAALLMERTCLCVVSTIFRAWYVKLSSVGLF